LYKNKSPIQNFLLHPHYSKYQVVGDKAYAATTSMP
jgi:hypothetical protein